MEYSKNRFAAAGLFVAIGIIVGCWILANAMLDLKARGNYVTVKGFAEKEFPADLAIWPISFKAQADSLTELHSSLEKSSSQVLSFLDSQDLGTAEITPSAPIIMENFRSGSNVPSAKYSGQKVITVRSGDIAGVKKAMSRIGQVVSQGVMLIRNYEWRPSFMFTRLNEVKPEMIAEATKDARRAAKQFAEDSGSRVGSIRRARQGVFSIQDRDQFTPEIKKVRVVNSVDYFLED